MYAYRTPGVYFEWRDKSATRLQALRTDITGFVGIAARGPLHTPVKIESWTQFVGEFGGHIPQGFLAYAVEGFFANGGQTCWVVRAADQQLAQKASIALRDDTEQATLCLRASSVGVWAHELIVTVLRTSRERFTLLLRHAEGGQELWPDLTMAVAGVEILNDQNRPVLKLTGTHPAIWNEAEIGRNTKVLVAPKSDGRFDLRIIVGNVKEESWPDLSFDRTDPRYVENVLNDPVAGSDVCVARDLHADGTAASLHARSWELQIDPRYVCKRVNDITNGSGWVTIEHLPSAVSFPDNTPNANAGNLHLGSARLVGGVDGLNTLTAQHLAGESGVPQGSCWGLGCLESVDEIAILAMPDIMPKPFYPREFKPQPPDCSKLEADPDPPRPKPQKEAEHPPSFTQAQILDLQQAMVRQCERLKDRVAVLDPIPEDLSLEAVLTWRRNFETSYAGFYIPWLRVPDPLRLEGLLRPVPPSGHMAGVYARGDFEVGVHKPPANQTVESAKSVTVSINDALHGEFNDAHVNAICNYSGRGLRVSGARTLSSDINLRYLNVRRLLIMIKESIEEGTQDLVFEPNNPELWRNIERRVSAFLDSLWRRGGLDGATAEDAYSVRCDEQTNPAQEQDAGRAICEIGILPPWPAEFVILRIGFSQSGAQLLEEGV